MSNDNKEIVDIVVSITRCSLGIDSKIVNMAMVTSDPDLEDFYMEFSNVDYGEIISIGEHGRQIYNDLHFKQYNTMDYREQDINIRMIKDSLTNARKLVLDYINDIIYDKNKKIVFWVNDITIWEPFILTFFDRNEDGLFNIPIDKMSPVPMDIGTVLRLPFVIDEKEKTLEDSNNIIGMTDDLLTNSLSEATFMMTYLKNNKIV